MKINKEVWKKRGVYSVFWAWHLIYIVLALAVFLPYLVPDREPQAADRHRS